MKVIQQIADYLLQHGVLSQKQYDGLEDGGFIDGPEGGGDRSAPELAKTPDSATAAGRTEAVEEAFDRTVPRRAGGGRPNRGATIKVARLRQMVGQRLDALEPVLQGLVPLASTLGPCESWDQATLAIRQASPEALLEAITESLEQGRPTLEPVGKVLEQEAFYEVVQDQTIKGPAVQAYRMLLAGTERTGLGKYAWILKHPEFKRVHNILLCQRSLALALKGLLDHRPRLLDRAFKRDFHPLVYAICVVVYTARQRTPAQVPTAGRGGPSPHQDTEHRKDLTHGLDLGHPGSPRAGDEADGVSRTVQHEPDIAAVRAHAKRCRGVGPQGERRARGLEGLPDGAAEPGFAAPGQTHHHHDQEGPESRSGGGRCLGIHHLELPC